MNVAEIPTIQTLAEPYQVPGALPDGITLSIGLIATTPPRKLKAAVQDADVDYNTAARNAYRTRRLEEDGAQFIEGVEDYRQLALLDAQNYAADAQSRVGLSLLDEGINPSAVEMSIVMRADAAVAEQAAKLAAVDQDPRVIAAKEMIIDGMTRRAGAELDLPALREARDLAHEVDRDTQWLARRGRIVSSVAGLVLGVGAGLGLAAHLTADSNSVDKGKVATTMSAATGTAGTIAGAGYGAIMGGRFARRRAQAQVRKAQARHITSAV